MIPAPLMVTLLVAPLQGTASESDREQGTAILIDALGGIEGVHVVPVFTLSEVPGLQQALDACPKDDDACAVSALNVIRADGYVAGAFDVEGGRGVVRLRLVATSTRGLVNARVTREVPEKGGTPAFTALIAAMTSELLPELAKRSFGTLAFHGATSGALLDLDGQRVSAFQSEQATLRAKPGKHAVRVTAPGRRPFETEALVAQGQTTDVEVDLAKIRSLKPLVLAGIGVVSAGAGVLFGLSAKRIENDWQSGCPAGAPCMAGFTRDRYDSDRSALSRDKVSADGLFLVAGVALVAAAVWFVLDPGSGE